ITTACRQGMAGALDRIRNGELTVLCPLAHAAFKEALTVKWTHSVTWTVRWTPAGVCNQDVARRP
ncbi:MAG: hypothetical protein P8M21_01730, partial [Halioglobus sp.]|nr:hypothetical protein [Halioglobus sp.]